MKSPILTLLVLLVTYIEFLLTLSVQYHKIMTSRQVMRIKKRIKKGIIGWSNSKFSNLTSHKLYGRQWGELLMKSWDLKG